MKKINLNLNHCLAFGIVTFIASCSAEKSSESTSSVQTCPTTAAGKVGGYVYCTGTATTATIELTGGSGEQYVVSPYVLGDHSTVKGAGEATASEFKISATSATLQGLKSTSPRIGQTDEELAMQLKMIANRFDASKGQDQEPWIWESLKRMDAEFAKSMNFSSKSKNSLSSHFAKLAEDGVNFEAPDLGLIANCPTSVLSADGSATVTIPSGSYDGTSFCIGYASDPSGDTKDNIQTSVKAVIDAYKDTIYQDKMTTNVKDGYSFNPVIVFSSAVKVANLDVDGVFSKTATTSAKRPVLHIKSTINKATLHATIAHEMQHAIVDYYKARGTSTIEETVGIDEGVAHLMEDAFGYGENNFNSYVKSFLTNFVDGSAILANNSASNAAAARGGAYSLVYFMAMRAGGFTVTSGKPFSGEGLKAVVSMVKQTDTNGPSALAAAFKQNDLSLRVGQLIGALFNDNRSLTFAPTEFTLSTYSGITDILGTTGLTFGIRFNSFRAFSSNVTTNTLKDASANSLKFKNYESYPVLITPSAASSTVTLTWPLAITNTGITVARIK